MKSPSRVFAVLNQFTEDKSVWQIDELCESLGYSRATGYRYVRELVDEGLLQKVSAGNYGLGIRIIELDYLSRRSDPVLLVAPPVIDDLVRRTRLDAVVSGIFGSKVIDTYRAGPNAALEFEYGRGRRRPLFFGAGPKVLLAHLPRNQLVKVFEQNKDETALHNLGKTWKDFRSNLAIIRKEGHYISRSEVMKGVTGVAVPLLNPDGNATAALASVGLDENVEAELEKGLVESLHAAAATIHDKMAVEFGGGQSGEQGPSPTAAS